MTEQKQTTQAKDILSNIASRKHLVLMIYGSTGSGKTTFLKVLLPKLNFPGGLYMIAPFYEDDFEPLIGIEGYHLTRDFNIDSIDEFRNNIPYDEDGKMLKRLFIIDDAMRFSFSENPIKRRYLNAFISDARHQGIDIIMCLQMFIGSPPSIRSQATDVVATRADRYLLSVLEIMFPTDISILSRGDKLRRLSVSNFEYLYINLWGECTKFKINLTYQ